MLRALSAAAMGAALLVFAPGAFGATVALDGATITYTAAAGEENDVNIDQGAGNITFDEDVIAITDGDGGGGCTIAAGDATCPDAGVTQLVIDTGDRDDSVDLSGGVLVPAIVSLGDGADFASGTNRPDTIDGGPGPDEIQGLAGEDVLNGAGGEDVLNGDDGNDQLNGGAGSDELNGDEDNDVLHGNDGQDRLDGDRGDDQLFGDAGTDFLENDLGADVLSGGDGHDALDSFGEGDDSWTQDGLANDGAPGEGDNWGSDLEDIFVGGSGDVTVIAGPADNAIFLGDGNNVVDGGPGSDQIISSNGDDTLRGGDGVDFIGGNGGNDVIDGGAGGDDVFGGDGTDLVQGGADADEVEGGGDADVLDGGPGADRLFGDNGADVIGGGGDVDTVSYEFEDFAVFVSIDGVANDGFAGEGDNVQADVENIVGGPGDDVLGGSAAVNSIDGAGGNDSIAVRDSTGDAVTCGAGIDSVVADGLDSIDPASGSCENVDRGAIAATGRKLGRAGVSVRKGRARVRVVCPLDALGGCAGKVQLRRGGRSVGSGSFITPTATRTLVSVKLPKSVARSVRRGRKVKVTLTITGRDLRAPLTTLRATVTLKR
jgi:Ca2+-binding RTX toxin-like protein